MGGSHEGQACPPLVILVLWELGLRPRGEAPVRGRAALWGPFQSHCLPQACARTLPQGGQSPLSPVLEVPTSILVGPWQPPGPLQEQAVSEWLNLI